MDMNNKDNLNLIYSKYTDSELLTYAAKAAGRELDWSLDRQLCWLDRELEGDYNNDEPWNPLLSSKDNYLLAFHVGCLHHIGDVVKSIYQDLWPQDHTLETTMKAIVVYAALQGGIADEMK